MSKQDVLDQLSTTMKSVFENQGLQISEATTADDVDEWDSLTHISLVQQIESAFKVKFALSELMKLQNVGDMADLILKKIKK
jgi:acyl carrier protein